MKKISIIIPVYNEQKTIEEVIKRVHKVDFGEVIKEIIVVDDGSSDESFNTVKKIKGIFLEQNPNNSGKASAIKRGIKSATGDIITIQDADLELDPKDLKSLIKPIIQGQCEVVYGTRYPKYKKSPKNAFLFYNGGRFISFLTNLLYGSDLTDVPCGYKAFKKEILNEIQLEYNRFEFEVEITAKILKRNIKILEIPVDYKPRTIKQGKKLKYRDGLKAIWVLIKNRLS